MYEGESDGPHIAKPETCCSNTLGPVFCENDCTRASEDNSRDIPCCYDADTSNSSTDFNLSTEEVSQDFHHRGFGEAAARGAKSGNFYPISEETVLFDSPPTIPTSSPMSVDSWVMYSNSSSDEYSLSQFNGGSSNEDTSDCESCSPKPKSNHSCTLQFAELELEDEDDEELTPTVSHKNSSKRLRVKDTHLSVPSGSNYRRSRSPTPSNVDVRMIDFAHTSFVSAKSSDTTTTSSTVHQGPDGGFLTGLDSLKRLLSQILAEG